MRKELMTMIMGACLLSACFSDDSSVGGYIEEIVIDDFGELAPVVSYSGKKLEVTPAIESGYPELAYKWSIVPEQDSNGDLIQPEVIGEERNLSYEVNLAPGEYILKLEVTAIENGYTVSRTADVLVTTQFSQGFYILKETDDGNTDVDLWQEDGMLNENLLSKVRDGGPMQGKPRNLSIAYNHWYIDTDDNCMKYDHLLSVISQSGDINMFRTTDLKRVFDRTNLLYGEMEADEQPYAVVHGVWSVYYLSNRGMRSNYAGDMGDSSKGSGKYGIPGMATGGSVHLAWGDSNCYHIVWWDESGSRFYLVDYNGGVTEATDAEGIPVDMSAYECVAAGTSYVSGGVSCFVMQDKETKARAVYTVGSDGVVSELSAVSPSSCLAKAELISVNGPDATWIYCVDGNKLYGYDWNTGEEVSMPLSGIPADETIQYVSNQYMGMYGMMWNMDYLIVGTSKGGSDYHLYFYNMLGGLPDGQPEKSVSGTGKVKSVRYASQSFQGYGGDSFPLTD